MTRDDALTSSLIYAYNGKAVNLTDQRIETISGVVRIVASNGDLAVIANGEKPETQWLVPERKLTKHERTD